MLIYDKNENMKIDCFAFEEGFDKRCKCIALKDMYCALGEECKFYKPKWKERAQRKAVAEYLRNR